MPAGLPPSRVRDSVLWEAVAWLAFAAAAYALSCEFAGAQPYNPLGAAFWPRVVIVIIVVASAVLFISRFLAASHHEEKAADYIEEVPDDLPGVTWRTIAIFVVPVLWVFAMHRMGFLLSTPVFLMIFTWLMGVKSMKLIVGFSLSFFAVLVVVFYMIIFTPLPMGGGIFHTITGEFLGLVQ